MIYKLDTDFTKIDQTDGLMQNLSHQAYIEVVTCEDDPCKDSGIILLPLEKLQFKTKRSESVYARSAHIGGTPANLSVVNFNVPASGFGAGVVIYAHTVLDGFIKADGALLRRDDYPELFGYAEENNLILSEADWANGMQGMFAGGDKNTTFRVPDLRGRFLRGLDDTAGVDAGRDLGSIQGDAIRNITGSIIVRSYTDGSYADPAPSGAFTYDKNGYRAAISGIADTPYCTGFDASRVVPTAEENRPKNIALIAQIKY